MQKESKDLSEGQKALNSISAVCASMLTLPDQSQDPKVLTHSRLREWVSIIKNEIEVKEDEKKEG